MSDRPVELDIGDLKLSEWIKPGARVMWGQGAAEPTCLTGALVQQRAALRGVTVFLTLVISDTLLPEHADHLRFEGLGGLGKARRLARAGVMEVYPAHLSGFVAAVATGDFRVDVAMVQLAGPDEHGYYSPGVDHAYIHELIAAAPTVLAEVNASAPFTRTSQPISPDDLDVIVHSNLPMPEMVWPTPDDIDNRIADFVAELVPDGATIQVGIGAVPSAILQRLHSRRDLGIHTGMLSDPVMYLIESGAVTNERKPIDAGLSTACLLLGSRELYRRASCQPLILESAQHTHSATVLSRMPTFRAINSAVEIDLTGQVNAEFAGQAYVGAVGGQVDFVRGARLSPDGRSITVMRSRTLKGIPRIVPALAGGIVTTARSDVDVVVTEWGVAELAHSTVSARARKLIAIAHPEDRAELTKEYFA